ncbi:MAG: hypothetical protein NTZ09_13555, partial [Candidatus Hydrogenedentes bacterium]|nr:hypothetical protein [Candidatus Hydrogenedentota bacterium]
MVEDEVEQGVIGLAKELSAGGLSQSAIMRKFREDKVPNRGESQWSVAMVRKLLNYEGLKRGWAVRKARLDEAYAARVSALEADRRDIAAGRVASSPLEGADAVSWGEKWLLNRDGARRAYWLHQVEDLRAEEDRIVHLDGRDVGKTADLTTLALHYALTTRKGTGLVAAALAGQLLAIWEEIEFQLETNPRLEDCIARGRNGQRKMQRFPYPRLEFVNGSVLYFRPAGAYGEAFRSLHVDRVWVDEGAWLSEEAWRALRQCLKSGGKLRVYSTPNGVRNATYYRLTNSRRWRVFRWPSWLNPNWSRDQEADLLEFYGGRGSAGWQHEVAGEHGAPSYGAFHPEQFALAIQDVPEYRKVVITNAELADCSSEQEAEQRLEALLGIWPEPGEYYVGADLGYTNDPTEILVFRRESAKCEVRSAKCEVRSAECEVRSAECEVRSAKCEETGPDGGGVRLVLRVHMECVPYPQIAQCLGVIDSLLAPVAIGVDQGGNGLAVVQELMTLDKYKSCGFEGRLFGFDFGSVTPIDLPGGMQVKKRTKELMTSLINRALQRREIVFPSSDPEIADQFLTQTYSLNNGAVTYSKGNDHIIDATRC